MCIVNMDKAFSKMSVSCSDHTWILREMTGNNHQPQQFEVESTFTSVFITFGWGGRNISVFVISPKLLKFIWFLREMIGNNHQPQQFEVESTFISLFVIFGWGENNI